MKEILSSFGSEFLRPLLTLFLPGALGCTPVAVCVLWAFPEVRTFAAANHSEAIAMFVLVSLFLGFVFESVGTRFEISWDADAGPQHREDWFVYLSQKFAPEPVGHRHLRTVVLHLKFELGCCVAAIWAVPWVLLWPTTYLTRGICAGAAAVIAYFFYHDARGSHATAAELRRELLDRLNLRPKNDKSATTTSGG